MAGEPIYLKPRSEEQMHYSPTWNITTIVSAVTLVLTIGGIGAIYGEMTGTMQRMGDKVATVASSIAVLDERTADVKNTEYRVGQTEAALVAGQKRGEERQRQITELRQDMNDLNTKIELILQSQKRIEETLGVRRK